MATLINATPVLNKKATRRFLNIIEQGLKNPVGPIPTPKLAGVLERINLDIDKMKEENKI